jgi:hypothetical protein
MDESITTKHNNKRCHNVAETQSPHSEQSICSTPWCDSQCHNQDCWVGVCHTWSVNQDHHSPWDRWGDIGDVAGARLLPIVCGRVHGNISISVVVVVVVVVVVTLGAAAAINCIHTGPSGSWKSTATTHGASSMIALRTICVVAKIGNIDIVVTRLTDRDLRLHLLRGWMDCEVHLNQASEMAFGVRPGLKQEGVTVLGPYWD